MSENIFYIVNILCHQIFTPAGAVTTFQKDAWNPHASGIIVCSTCSIHGSYQIIHMCDFSHLTALCSYFRSCCPCTVYIGHQSLKSIPAVQIHIVICLREKLCHNCISNSVTECTIRISRENSVQVFSILIGKTHGTVLKSGPVHQTDHYDISRNFFRIQFVCKLHGSLDSYIFCIMHTAGDQDCLALFLSADQCYRDSEFCANDMHKSGYFLTRLRL